MTRIRVMHVVGTLATGGTENGVRKVLSGLDPDRFEQSVCTIFGDREPEVLGGATSFCLNRVAGRPSFLIPQLERLFARQRPDIVHSRNWGTIEAIPAARLAGIAAVVHSEHGRDMETIVHQGWKKRLLRRMYYRWADQVFCVSQELKQHYCRELGWSTDRFRVLTNGVDTDRFCRNERVRSELRLKNGVGANTLVVGTVGRLDLMKDHLTLFRAAAIALARGLNLRLVIVGEGGERHHLERVLASNPNLAAKTEMVGEVHNVENWLNAFDVFVLPSLSEGMSNSLLEAMAVGVPPIATAVGGNAEVIEDRVSGLLVPPRQPEMISGFLSDLAADSPRRRAIGGAARKRIESKFSLKSMLQQYEALYCQVLGRRNMGFHALSRA